MTSSADNLTIETPEQTSLDFPLAGVGSRFLAMAVDMAIQGVVAFIIFLGFVLLLPAVRWATVLGPQWMIAGVVIVLFLLNSGYFAFFEAIWNGQTPGKRYAQIRVMKDDGRPISAYDSMARNLLRIADELPGMYAVGVISIIFSKQNKRLGDFVAGTVVVHEKTIQEARPFLEIKSDDAGPVYDTSRITLDELHLIETFLHRRDSFDPALRNSMAAKISIRIGEKVGARVMGWPQTEKFLEAVYERYRSSGRYRS
ncbi:MAG TPA: RDD family protein [Candidatus Acidoferrales bacterium]|nr:RDD family protein [Candidatus Acidoferrales bacterium]